VINSDINETIFGYKKMKFKKIKKYPENAYNYLLLLMF